MLQHIHTQALQQSLLTARTALRDGLKLTSPDAAHCSYSDRPPTSTRQTEQTWPAAAAPSASASWPLPGPRCQLLVGATRCDTRRPIGAAAAPMHATSRAGGGWRVARGLLESSRLHRLPLWWFEAYAVFTQSPLRLSLFAGDYIKTLPRSFSVIS